MDDNEKLNFLFRCWGVRVDVNNELKFCVSSKKKIFFFLGGGGSGEGSGWM